MRSWSEVGDCLVSSVVGYCIYRIHNYCIIYVRIYIYIDAFEFTGIWLILYLLRWTMEFLLQAGWLRGFGMSGLVILVALAMWYWLPCRLLPDWMLLHRSLQCSADMQTVDCCCISLKPFFIVLPGVFMVAFLQNILGAWLTPFAKKLLATRRKTVRIARGTRHCILSFHAFPTFYILLLLFDCTFFCRLDSNKKGTEQN